MNEHTIPKPADLKNSRELVALAAAPAAKGKPHSRTPGLIAGLAALLIASIAAATWWTFAERNAPRYVTVPVAKGAVIRTVTATGTVNPELTIIVGDVCLRRHSGADLRLQHPGEKGTDLRQDRPASLSEHRR